MIPNTGLTLSITDAGVTSINVMQSTRNALSCAGGLEGGWGGMGGGAVLLVLSSKGSAQVYPGQRPCRGKSY